MHIFSFHNWFPCQNSGIFFLKQGQKTKTARKIRIAILHSDKLYGIKITESHERTLSFVKTMLLTILGQLYQIKHLIFSWKLQAALFTKYSEYHKITVYFFTLHYQRQLRYYGNKKASYMQDPSAKLKMVHFDKKKHLNKWYDPTFWTVGHNLIHSSSSRHRFHKYSILITTWPFKPFLVEIHNLIKMLSSAIYKFKNPTKDLKSKHQNHFKRNMTRFSHKKNIHRNFQSI